MSQIKQDWTSSIKRWGHWLLEHLLGHVVTLPIVSFLGFVGLALISRLTNNEFAAYVYLHPFRMAASALALGFAIALSVRIRKYSLAYFRNQELLSEAGLKAFRPHKTKAEKEDDWKQCCAQIANECPNDIRILGATGWETFGHPDSPLHKLLCDFEGEIQVLLISPKCTAFKERALSLHISETSYEQQVKDSIEFCKKLKAEGKLIQVKLYTQTPIWKMIFTNSYLWLQHYQPNDHVDNTPVYTFFANKKKTSLYFPLINVFRKRWDRDGNETVDLANRE